MGLNSSISCAVVLSKRTEDFSALSSILWMQNALPELSLSSLYVLAAYVLFIMSGATGALLRCLPLMLALVLSHAALRQAATEYKAGGAMGVEFGCGLPCRSALH